MRHGRVSMDRIAGSKLLSLGILAVLAFSLMALGKVCARHYGMEKEIAAMEKEADGLEGDNVRLAELIEHAAADSFMEREARLKLGMRMPGEKAVVIVPPEGESGPAGTDPAEKAEEAPNYEKWLEHFIGK